jgi:KUP system potassium uptake protein
MKIPEGGWFPLLIGGGAYAVMMTWIWGRQRIGRRQSAAAPSLDAFLRSVGTGGAPRVAGTGVYLTQRIDEAPAALRHKLNLSQDLHQRNVLMMVETLDVPRLDDAERVVVRHLDGDFHAVTVRYGFFEAPDIPRALELCRPAGLAFDLAETTFYIGRQKIVPTPRSGLSFLFKRLFIAMARLSLDATEFFRIPIGRVVEFGGQVEL